MRITALEEYGLRCLLTLAQAGTEEQLSISDIAEKEGLSIPYTSKLLSILRKSGLVTAIRGRKGGFCIARKPAEIDLFEALTVLGGPLIDPDHCKKYSGQLEKCIHTDKCSVHYTLAGLSHIVGQFLSDITLEDVMNGSELVNTADIESKVTITAPNKNKELNEALYKSESDTNSVNVLDKQDIKIKE